MNAFRHKSMQYSIGRNHHGMDHRICQRDTGNWMIRVYSHKVTHLDKLAANVYIHYHRHSRRCDRPIQQSLVHTNILPLDSQSCSWYWVHTSSFHMDGGNRCRHLVSDTNTVGAHHKLRFRDNHCSICMWRQLCNGCLDLDLESSLQDKCIGMSRLCSNIVRRVHNDSVSSIHQYLH